MSSLVICLFVERKAIEFHVLVRSQVDHKRNKIRTAEKSVTHLLIAIVPRFSSKLIQKVIMDPNRRLRITWNFSDSY